MIKGIFIYCYMKEVIITAFKNIKDSKTPHYITLEKSVKRILQGASKEMINKIREEKDKSKRNVLKSKLPSICYGGEFKERSKSSLVNHSGLMITDFDNIPKSDYDSVWKKIVKIKHTVLAFESPSNSVDNIYGIKALIKIPKCDAETHSKYFKAFQEKYNFKYWDESNSDVSRVCFESYDPNAYINFEAETFDVKLKDEGFDVQEKVPIIPLNDEGKIIEKILKWNWQKDFVDGQKNNFIFDLAGAFCEYGVSQHTAESFLYNNIIAGSCKDEKSKINSVRSAYKKRSFGSKYFEDYETQNAIKANLKKGKEKILKEFKIDEETYSKLKIEAEVENFWEVDEKDKLTINPLKFKLFLERNGFKKYYPSEANKPNWVIVESNKVSEVSTEKIKDFVLKYLEDKREYDVWNYCAKYQNLFSESFLLMLDSIELTMLKDTKTKSFLAFENGILEVTKESVNLLDYLDVDSYIWKSNIIPRNFEVLKDCNNEYKKFINNISNNNPLPIECVLGYLLCRYKNKMNNKAVILNDEVISDNPEGGTGKGLFVQGIKQLRKVSILDGKTFDDKKSFPYQTVSQDSDILVFDDIKKNWDFESKFSLVTEGMTLERKNKDAIKLSVEDSPKMLISTNYAVKGEGNSHDRRRHEIEIAQHYGKNLTPFDEFGHQLFDDWDEKHFLRFDNYMIKCIQSYLQNGLIIQTSAKNIKKRKFIAETSMEFLEWIEDFENFPLNKRNFKIEKYQLFLKDFEDYKSWLKRKRFVIWVQKYSDYIGGQYKQDISNGQRWFMIVTNEKEIHEDEAPF